MKRLIFKAGILAVAIMGFISCSDILSDMEFDVTMEKSSWQLGEEIVFTFNGNPDYITFYSDEKGCDYDYAGVKDPDGVVNWGLPVKAINTAAGTYAYTYQAAGQYEAVFVAKNVSDTAENEKVVRLQITIE